MDEKVYSGVIHEIKDGKVHHCITITITQYSNSKMPEKIDDGFKLISKSSKKVGFLEVNGIYFSGTVHTFIFKKYLD
jgi:hypothetical protein